MARRRAREALAASAQNRHPSYPRLGELGHNSPRYRRWAKSGPDGDFLRFPDFLLQNRGCKGGLDYWPRGGHPKIAWKLRRSSLHRGRLSPIFWGNFHPQALSSKFRRVK
ncbi:hypothetical protein U9M48_024605, partial [Paspalum notatum var. saurae]